MENQVTKHFPSLAMSDYRVDYTNHSGYKGGADGKVRGSPARIFTDIPLKQMALSPGSDYRFALGCVFGAIR